MLVHAYSQIFIAHPLCSGLYANAPSCRHQMLNCCSMLSSPLPGPSILINIKINECFFVLLNQLLHPIRRLPLLVCFGAVFPVATQRTAKPESVGFFSKASFCAQNSVFESHIFSHHNQSTGPALKSSAVSGSGGQSNASVAVIKRVVVTVGAFRPCDFAQK
jgi:hypothetical protein